jgi:hypothetical protein
LIGYRVLGSVWQGKTFNWGEKIHQQWYQEGKSA